MAIVNKQMKTFNVPNGNDTTRYEIVDANARENLVKVSETTPQDSVNKLWIKDTTVEEFEIPTMSEFNDVKSALSASTGNERLYLSYENQYISLSSDPVNLTPAPAANYSCGYWSCNEGDKFTISGSSYGTGAKLYAFLDSSRNRLATAPSSSANNLLITAPENAAYLVSNTYQNTVVLYKGEMLQKTVNDINVELGTKASDAELQQLKSDVNYIAPVRYKNIFDDFEQGYFNNSQLYLGSGGYITCIEMQNGAKYEITATGTYNRFAIGYGNNYANNVAMSGRTSYTVSSPNKAIFTNTGNYKYLFVFLNSGTSDFSCTCTIYETVGNPDELTLNGVDILNKEQVNRKTDNKEVIYKTAVIENVLVNGDFHTRDTPMQYANCTGAVSDGVLTATGNGADKTIKTSYYYPITNVGAHHYFCGMYVKANSSDCDKITLRIAGGLSTIDIVKPQQNKWYYIAGRYAGDSTGDTSSAFAIWAEYANASTQSGKSISIKEATAYFIGTDFGIGTDPMLYKLLLIHGYNDFWIGSKEVIIWKGEKAITKVPTQKWSFGQRRRPLVTFVDDDGWQNVYTELSPISEKYNVPFVSAIQIGSTINDWNALYLQNNLKWELAVHPDCGQEGGLATLETEEEIRQWMVDTNTYLDNRGFKWKNVVYAAGEPDERVRRIAKEFYNCGAVGSSPKVNRGVIANFEIQRIPIGYPMSSEWNTFANLKSFIDDAIAHNGWCIFMTHAGMTTWHTAEITQIIDQLVDYCVNTVEVDVVTLQQGFEVFGNAVESGDFLGENARAGDSHKTGVAISQSGYTGNIINVYSMDNLLTTLGAALNGTFETTCDYDTGVYSFTFTPNA